MILLDTHVIVWLAEGNAKLGRRALARIDAELRTTNVAVSAISFWEIEMLIAAGRIKRRRSSDDVRADALRATIREIPIDGVIAILAGKLHGLHGDPVDRLIGATALEHNASLVTADAALLDWKGGPKLVDASV